MLTRRDLLKAGLVLGGATLVPGARRTAISATAPLTLPEVSSTSSGVSLTPFVDALPVPSVLAPRATVISGAHFYEIAMQEFTQKLHRDLPPTTVWGYQGLYPGPTIEAQRNVPVFVRWVNDLRDPSGALRTTHYLPVNLCPHGPDTQGATPRTVVHLHGGKVPPESDGYPEATILPGQRVLYYYPNAQRPATLWYHDHALGITRLNVYMGLAGFYLIRDPATEGPLNLPSGEFELPLVIQDRAFNADGSLNYPASTTSYAFGFLGDTVLVNGKVWPYLAVKRGKYRFRMLNGSNTRAYTLGLSTGGTMYQIGTDGGFLGAPVPLTQLTLAPAERADVVIDFAVNNPGDVITLVNTFPDAPSDAVPNVLQFRVGSATGHLHPLPPMLSTIEFLSPVGALERDINLTFAPDPCTGIRFGINAKQWDDIVEQPKLGATEVWRIINTIGSPHPIHIHLVAFQILDRQACQPPPPPPGPVASPVEGVSHAHRLVGVGSPGGDLALPDVPLPVCLPVGPVIPPPANEAGWKDTVFAQPNQITRVIARFEGYTGRYPYHCHILEHEDHEMMRQFEVVLP